MATNVTEKDKTLNEIIDWCTGMGQKMMNEANASGLAHSLRYTGAAGAYMTVIKHCQDMLGYSGSRSMRCGLKASKNTARRHKASSCMEECSELIQAISKRLRGKPDATDNLAEEMADVIICLNLLKEMYGITDERLDKWITRKTARQYERMQADDPFMESEATE